MPCSLQLIPAQDGCDHHSAQKDRAHLPNIRRETGVEYTAMLFFDDEMGNIKKARGWVWVSWFGPVEGRTV